MSLAERHTKALHKKARRGFNGYPVATVTYYGPDARRATKVTLAVIPAEGAEPKTVERWFNPERDVRRDHQINEQIMQFIRAHEIHSVAMSDGIIGCPHEEGIDYPEGQACPHCPYWADREGGESGAAPGDGESGSATPGPEPASEQSAGAGEAEGAVAALLQAPCPCGSGRVFGECCARGNERSGSGTARAVNEELARALEGQSFASLEEAQAFVEKEYTARNRRGIDDFDGLSPEQMHALLYAPFESPPLDGLEQRLPGEFDAPVLALFIMIADAARDRGIKLTARGNLPLKLVKAAQAWLRSAPSAPDPDIGSASTERDVGALHHVRLVAGLGGLLRKSRGYLYLTRRAETLLDRGDWPAIYRRLFETYCQKFNWAYADGFADLRIIQQAFAFTLYLLHRHGAAWQPEAFYEERFLRAFPMALDEVDDRGPGLDPERHVRYAWSSRALHEFGSLFGLIERGETEGRASVLSEGRLQIRAQPLLGHVFPHPPPG